MPIAEANGIRIYYEVHGQGYPLLTITGLGYGAWFWHRFAPLLAHRYRVITFDNRGAGQSDKPDGPYTLAMMAADAAGLLDALGISRAAVMGISLGGLIAQELVWIRPDLVDKLILAGTMHGGPKAVPVTPETQAIMERLARLSEQGGDPAEIAREAILASCPPGFAEQNPSLVQEQIDYRLSNPVPPAQYQAQMQASAAAALMTEDEVVRRLSSIRVPTLILHGDSDVVVPVINARLLAEKIPGSRLLILPGCGHKFPLEAPEVTAKVVIEFLTGGVDQ